MVGTPAEFGSLVSRFTEGMFTSAALKYSMYIVILAIFGSALLIIYYWMQFKYKVTYPILHYDKNQKSASIIGYKKDRARIAITKEGKKCRLLWLRKDIKPFAIQDINPGNKINVLKFNDDGTYIPMPGLEFMQDISAFESLTPEESFWGVQTAKEIGQKYQDTDTTKKIMFMVIGTTVLCLIMVGITVYLCLKAPTQAVESVNSLLPPLKSIAGSIGGGAPY